MATQFILVSGLSGSGKSIALGVLEDDGYYCVDNLPATLLGDVVGQLVQAGEDRIAISVDARSAALAALPDHLARLRGKGIDCRALYLEADTPTLLRRYSETRRRHPLERGGLPLGEAIARERALLAGVSELAQRLDTTGLQPKALRQWLRELLGLEAGALSLVFESFAFRQGVPLDADWVIDARMLPNPHYEPALRELDGRDPAVVRYLESQDAVRRFLGDVSDFLSRWMPEIEREGRRHVTVAIGCTGGRHRSVFLAERLAQHFRGRWRVLVRHRALARDEAEAAA